ncbi:MAG TPA: hypothetical protein VH482_20420 [Thermomicrobiales bacterium]|jgi:hypothetical protein
MNAPTIDRRCLTEPRLTPEEDAIGAPDDEDDDIDDLLPADLWF